MRRVVFQPDIVIEATNACDRACHGCYAPNIVVRRETVLGNTGITHLSIENLEASWSVRHEVPIIAVRGGEPTLNPIIDKILVFLSKRSGRIFLETNGNWIGADEKLLSVLANNHITVKLSLDDMHGSTPEMAEKQIHYLSKAGISVAIAVTASTVEEFEKTCDRLLPNFNGEIFWQKKALSANELIHPTVGVINTRGIFQDSLTSKFQNVSVRTKVVATALAMVLSLTGFSSYAQSERKVTVGIAANFSAMSDSTSNPYANYFRNAIEMAFEENKEFLKSKGIAAQIKEFDYSDDKLKVIETANAAIQSEVLAVLGYIYSSDVLLAGPIFAKNKLLLISPTATADRVEEIGDYVRRTCFNDSYQGKILADFAFKTKKIKNVAIVSIADCAYCQSLRSAFKGRFEALGGKITVDQTVLSNEDKFESVISAFKGKTYDAIFVPNYERISATIISQLHDAGVKPKFWLGGDGWGNSVDLFYRIVGKRSFKAYTISHWHREIQTAKSKSFFTNFSRKYGKPPVDTAVLAYDAANLLIQGLASAKTLSRDGILEAVKKIKSFDGVTGQLIYPPSGRTPTKSAVLLRLEDGTMNVEKIIGAK